MSVRDGGEGSRMGKLGLLLGESLAWGSNRGQGSPFL